MANQGTKNIADEQEDKYGYSGSDYDTDTTAGYDDTSDMETND